MSFIYAQHPRFDHVRYCYPESAVVEICHDAKAKTFRLLLSNRDEANLADEPYTVEVRAAGQDFELWLVYGDPHDTEDLDLVWRCQPVESVEMQVPIFTRHEAEVLSFNPVGTMPVDIATEGAEMVLVDLKRKRAAHVTVDSRLQWSSDLAAVLELAAAHYTHRGCIFTLPDWLADDSNAWSGLATKAVGAN